MEVRTDSFLIPRYLTLFTILFLIAITGYAQEKDLRQEEETNYYKKWLNEDVKFIITSQEKDVFTNLNTPEEKDQFIEQFWRRRDTDTETSINEYKEEHYRRIAYANEHFYSGGAGWRTDRGWIYIKYGPPEGIDKHPEGGFYARKHSEGGGFTSTYPFEVWFYNRIDGVGDGIEIEFVDPSRTNEYRIAVDDEEKDALLHVPGAGLTVGEMTGAVSRKDRIRFRGMVEEQRFRYRTARDYPFQRLQTMYNLQQAPVVEFKDLEKIVEVRMSYQQLPVEVKVDQIRINSDTSLIPVTIFIDNKELTFEMMTEDVNRATLDLYGRVETVGGQIEYVFEDSIKKDISRDLQAKNLTGKTLYQKRLPLKAGRYKLSLVVKEESTGKIYASDQLIQVETKPDTELFCSSLILSPRVYPVSDNGSLSDPFVLTAHQVRPVEDDEFSVNDGFVQSYFEVYNLELDQSTLKPSASVEISLLYWGESGKKNTDSSEIFPFTQIQDEFEFFGDRLLIYKTIPFAGLSLGRYTLLFRIKDQIRNESVEQQVDFKMVGD